MRNMYLCKGFFLLLLWCCCLEVEVACQTALTDDDVQDILETHNVFRGMVEPGAANMAELVRYTSSCIEQCRLDEMMHVHL